jgi:hypothetical protein
MDAQNPAHVAVIALAVGLGFVAFVGLLKFADWLTRKIP